MNAPAPHPNDDVPAQPGQVLAGKYRVDRVLGRGGMGIVVEARHVQLDERVALKFLLPDYAQHPEASQRFLREARAAVKIKSEHVARVSDVGTLENGSPYMVMEFLEGTDLSKALERYGVCQIPDAIDYLLQTCEAIAEAHGHGIIHRDLKPANLFLTRRPDGTPMIKVLDFGISKMAGSGVDNLTRTTTSMGSALYMSPEQMQTTRGVDHRTDIYALGISLYELLAGKQPYYADTLPQLCAEVLTGTPTPIRQLRAEVPDGLAAVLERAYARDREQRYQTIAELCAGLAPWAPTRSQNTLDRVARMAGVALPVAGAAARQVSSPGLPSPGAAPQGLTGSQPNLAISGGSPAIQYMNGPAAQTGNHPAPVPPVAQPPQAASQTGNYAYSPHDALAIGGYHGPASAKASAAFAAGASTNTNLSRTGGMPGAASRTGLFVAIAVLAVALLALGTAFLFVRSHADPAPASSTSADSPPPPPATPTLPATATPTAEPTTSPTAAATTTAEPAPSTAATVAPSGTPTAKPKTPVTKPTGSAKKPGVMTSR